MVARLDAWIIYFIAASAQGLFLTAMLFVKQHKSKRQEQKILALLILSFTITIAYYTTFWTGINQSLSPYWRIILEFTFLFGPLTYFYLHQTVKGRLPQNWALHFLPFLISVGLRFLAFNWLASISGFFYLIIFQISQIIFYAALCIHFSRKNEDKWLKQVAFAFSGYAICFMMYYALLWTGVLKIQHDYMVSVGMTVLIYFIGYHGFKSPLETGSKTAREKYQKSSLTPSSIEYICEKLDTVMEQERLFTDGELKLQTVANKLDVSVHALSQAVNVAKEKKFTDYLSELRVTEAIRLMRSKEYEDAKLLAVALDSGFNNKTSFLNAFKKQVGQPPSEYRKQIYSQAS